MVVLGFFIFFMTMWSSDAFKALVVYPMPARSHGILGHAVVKQLLKDGNEVTYISAFEYKNAPWNLRQIDVSKITGFMTNTDRHDIKKILNKEFIVNDYTLVKPLIISLITKALGIEEVQELMNDNKEQFDVVIVEWMFSELFSGLAAVFNCPLIWVSSMEVNYGILSTIDAPPNPAYIADTLSSNIPPFTLSQRIEELWIQIRLKYLSYMYYDPMETEVYETLMAPSIVKRGRQPPTYYDVKYNASLVIGNSHIAMGQATSLPQSYKHVGGYHIDEEVKPLPEDLQKIIDSSKYGVIYFSMGSNLKSKDWPEGIRLGLLKMFGELKQTVLWKFEEDLPNVPNNVHLLKWSPQLSILSHKNCLLFISHGGLLSITETIHSGIPIIGIPVYGDQFMNVNKIVKKGFGLKVDFTFNIVEDLKVAIEEMLYNTIYSKKAKELSFIYHDRPVKPSQELSHWVRHVVQTQGAGHLRSPAIDVPLYQLLYLDLIIIIVIFIFVVYLLKSCCNVINSKNDLLRQKNK